MKEEIAKEYLTEYANSTKDIFLAFLKEQNQKYSQIDPLVDLIFNRFAKLAAKGKRFRGALTQLGYELGGGEDIDAIRDVSIFIELLHAGLLVHDDVMDRDEFRRGLPTMHKQFKLDAINAGLDESNASHYGESMAIDVGDLAFYLSWDSLMQSNFSDSVKIAVARHYSEYVIRTAFGQALDVTANLRNDVAADLANKILQLKTAEYTGVMPLVIGAVLAGKYDDEFLQLLRQYGLALGWVFQVQDDILGLFGDEQALGKPVGSDLEEGKMTLLMLKFFEVARDEDKKIVQSILGKSPVTRSEVNKVRELIKKSGVYDLVVKMGKEQTTKALQLIPQITRNKRLQDILEGMLQFVFNRIN